MGVALEVVDTGQWGLNRGPVARKSSEGPDKLGGNEPYRWTADNKKIAQILNNLLPPDGPETYDPNPDHTAAREAVKRFGGEVLSFDKPKFDPKVIY